MQTILSNLVEQTIDQIATFLTKEHADLFAKKTTKAALLKILKGAASPAPAAAKGKAAKKEVEEVVDETEDSEAADEEPAAGDHPEGWTADEWTKFCGQMKELEDGHLLSVTTCKSNNGKKKSGLVVDETFHLCAKKGEEDALQTVVDFLNALGGDEAAGSEDESEEIAAADDEETEPADADESEENDYVDGYDAKKLATLKKALEKAEDGEHVNITSGKKVKKSAANEKKMVFDDDLKLAFPKLANDKEQKAYRKRIAKMLA
jgi:hypothetical protein